MSVENVMLDLETLGKKNNAAILSIGAVVFSAENGIGSQFYLNIDVQSCIDVGMAMDASTIVWWMKQSDEARSAFIGDKSKLLFALKAFSAWYPGGADLWGNGAAFDNVILGNAYDLAGVPRPWAYTNDCCYRTLRKLYPQITAEHAPGDVAHNALSDALYQAQHAVKILRHIKGYNPTGELKKLS